MATDAKLIYEYAKDRNQGREPDELHLAYEREMWRLRAIESAAVSMAARMIHHAHCELHPESKPNARDCPFCEDRLAYRMWQRATKLT